MSEDMRTPKFKMLVKKLDKLLGEYVYEDQPYYEHAAYDEPSKSVRNVALLLIYDYESLNEYGKIIMENSHYFPAFDEFEKMPKTMEEKMAAAEKFVETCDAGMSSKRYYEFIFWALMTLAVDKTDKEEKLSVICDFVRMIDIDDDAVMDILRIVKIVLRQVSLSDEDIDLVESACWADKNDFFARGGVGFKDLDVVLEMRELIKIYH